MADRAERRGNMRPAFVWNPELRDSLPNVSGIPDSLESAALQAAHGEPVKIRRPDPLKNKLKAPKAPRFDDAPEIFTAEMFSDSPLIEVEEPADEEVGGRVSAPIIPMPIIAVTPVPPPPNSVMKPRSIPKPPRPFDLELASDVLVDIRDSETDLDPDIEIEPAPASHRSSAPPVVRTLRPVNDRLARGMMVVTGAAAGALLAFAFSPSKGSASVPLSRALTTPVVVFTLEQPQKTDEPAEIIEHRVDEAVVLDLDAEKRAAPRGGPPAALPEATAAIVKPQKRKRPRVVLEHAPYGSIPARPGERVAAYPMGEPLMRPKPARHVPDATPGPVPEATEPVPISE